jgi:hypothetical protein
MSTRAGLNPDPGRCDLFSLSRIMENQNSAFVMTIDVYDEDIYDEVRFLIFDDPAG